MSEWWDDPRDIRIRHRHAWQWDEECGATITGRVRADLRGPTVDLRCVNTRGRHVYHRDASGVLFRLSAAHPHSEVLTT